MSPFVSTVDGTIALPYAGRFMARGRRVSDIESDIVARLAGKAVDPSLGRFDDFSDIDAHRQRQMDLPRL